jgi:flagellar hook-associated protein 1 FlgK
MSFNLMNIGTSGIRSSTELLQTTSKNIANLNTEGYVRERTEHVTLSNGQVGRGETVRLLNEFAQRQLNRDISNTTFYEQFVNEAERVDLLFAEESNSLANSINSLYNNLQESINQPSSSVTRSLFFTDVQSYLDQASRLSDIVLDQKNIVNEQLDIFAEDANKYIEKISSLNKEIASISAIDDQSAANAIFNERDKAIKDLAELMDVQVLDGKNGEKLVFAGTGEALVMENGAFSVFVTNGDPDLQHKNLQLDVKNGNAAPMELDSRTLKGKIGGLFAFRDEILIPAQTQLGQMTVAMADAMNQQNRLGMDLNGNLGGDLFTIPSVDAMGYQANTGSAALSATLEPGQGMSLTATDFRVTFTSATTVQIEAIDNYGQVVGTPSTANVVAGRIDSSSITSGEAFGLQIDVTGVPANADQFEIKFNSEAATTITLTTGRSEDLALASPIRMERAIGNQSTAALSEGLVTDTSAAGFNAGPPPSFANGPISLVKTANPDEYEITDTRTGTAVTFTASAPRENILAQAALVDPVFATYGFDFNIEGVPQTGDSFSVEFNTGGFDDNRNGMALLDIKNKGIVRENVVASALDENHKTVNAAYTELVTDVGVKTNQARTNFVAFEALSQQSETWYESLSGVNLDEEASNLLRFQQSYAASAQVISAAKNVFDTLLNAAR